MTERIEVVNPSDPDASYYALVDDEDYPLLSRFRWAAQVSANNTIYAKAYLGQQILFMHALILGTASVDHRNSNGLDNRKENLRLATPSQNQANRRKFQNFNGKPASSQYKGVSWDKRLNKWRAYVGFEKKIIYLGVYLSEEEAARAYDKKACELFSDFARLNFPLEREKE